MLLYTVKTCQIRYALVEKFCIGIDNVHVRHKFSIIRGSASISQPII